VPLDRLPARRLARIEAIDPAAAGQPAERARQLADLGFTPGELVAVLARAWPGGDPLVVRVGPSRFALRRAEAACVRVRELP
jgi:ferrous iron transport protein A